MEPTRRLRRAVCIAAVALVMIAGGGCRPVQVADDAARVADDAARVADDAARVGDDATRPPKNPWEYFKIGAEVASKVQDARNGSQDKQSK